VEAEPAPLRLALPAIGTSGPSAQAWPASEASEGDADHMRALYVQTPVILAGNLIGIALTSAIFWAPAGPSRVLGWAAMAGVLWLVRLGHWLRVQRTPDATPATLLAWRTSWRALALAQGAMWGVAVWVFWGFGEPYRQLALILIVYSYCLGSVQLLSTQPRVFLAFLCLVLLPTIARIATDESQPWHLQLACILLLLFGITWGMGRTYGGALWQAIALKHRTDTLAEQLRIEKGQADAARRVAEAASQAKTQFFAAASHDLRQPLHAMGLFAEALRQRSHDPEVASLVNSINESVDALEGLFGELLDITRIDTGGVEVNPAPVRMRELFARLRLQFEPVAFERGLQLSFRGEQHVAQVDPVIVERILRNLVSNAIRYTDDGGVLVCCRRWRGALRLQVWDSGSGIAEATLPRIFDEFYQVQGSRPLQPHQRKGLGLGLAIVKRLADLIGSAVAVRSRVGHGTVFTFDLPAGRMPRPAEPPAPGGKPALGLTLQGRQIVVVEDEPAVREGLTVLLKAWGASVQAFDTVAEVEAWLATGPAEAPDLLIVDYRLPQGTTGLQAMAALRAAWSGRKLPAIVVTGSSMGGHEDEAAAHDFHLMVKPVLPNKLRAMIAFKLGVR
jgi:two-component system, sensor histidine kinase